MNKASTVNHLLLGLSKKQVKAYDYMFRIHIKSKRITYSAIRIND